jgi:HK97 gp10 family phage protein
MEVNGIERVIEAFRLADKVSEANVTKAVEVTSRHIKDDAKKNAKEVLGDSVRHQASTYQYEIKHPSKGVVEGWIGPVKGWKQAAIPLEYGTPYTAAKPVLEPALAGNVEDLVKGISMAVGEAL